MISLIINHNSTYTKNKHTPATLTTAPMTSRTVTLWWNRMAAGAMMRMGVSAKMVCAMPAEVYIVANNDALTPMKGPKMVEANTHPIALRSRMALRNFAKPSLQNSINDRKKPASPM